MAVYQFELDLENEVTQEQADYLRGKLQEYGRKFIGDYPMLVSPDSGGGLRWKCWPSIPSATEFVLMWFKPRRLPYP